MALTNERTVATNAPLLELLGECTIRIEDPWGEGLGAGFYIAPGVVLTCRHVIGEEAEPNVRLRWHDRMLSIGSTRRAQAAARSGHRREAAEVSDALMPDLAVLEVDCVDHPCVPLFGNVALGDPLYCVGYPAGYEADPVTAFFEGLSADPVLLKFKQGQIQPGHSGGPILNWRTGAVCGVVTLTRGNLGLPDGGGLVLDIGGRGEPVATVLAYFPDLRGRNAKFHSLDSRWLRLLTIDQRRAMEKAPVGNRAPWRWGAWAAAIRLTSPAAAAILRQDDGDDPGAQPAGVLGEWETLGPSGGDVRTVIADPITPRLLIVALSQGGGVYRSDDGGHSWTAANLGLGCTSVAQLAISVDSGVLYAATGEGEWVSADGGHSWSPGNPRFAGRRICSVTTSPTTPGLVLTGTVAPGGTRASVASVGLATSDQSPRIWPTSSVDAGHLHVSRDGGATWITFPVETINGSCISPGDEEVIYVASADGGLFRSDDALYSLQRLDNFPGKQPLCVGVSPRDATVLVGTLKEGLYRSDDAGASWRKVEVVGDVQVSQVSFAPTDGQSVWAATAAGLFESADGGLTWSRSANGPAYTWCMCVTATEDGTVLVGTSGGGIYRRIGVRGSWTAQNSGLPPVTALTVRAADEGRLVAGTSIGVFESRDRARNWKLRGCSGEAVTALAVSPTQRPLSAPTYRLDGLHASADGGRSFLTTATTGDQSCLYAGTIRGEVLRSTDSGRTWKRLPPPKPADSPLYGGVRALAAAGDSFDRVYAVFGGAGGIWRSRDAGTTWEALGVEQLGELVNTLHVRCEQPLELYVATVDRGVWTSSEEGHVWTRVESLADEVVTDFATPAKEGAPVFAATVSLKVFRTTNHGRWKVLFDGGRAAAHAHENRWATVAVSSDGSSIALGSGCGVHLSVDGGRRWRRVPGGALGECYHVNALLFPPDGEAALLAATTTGILRTQAGHDRRTADDTVSGPHRVARHGRHRAVSGADTGQQVDDARRPRRGRSRPPHGE